MHRIATHPLETTKRKGRAGRIIKQNPAYCGEIVVHYHNKHKQLRDVTILHVPIQIPLLIVVLVASPYAT